MKLIILWFLLFTTYVVGQPWASPTQILSSGRAIDWSHAGLPSVFPDGETTPNPWTPPTRTTICTTLNPSGGDDAPLIRNALQACAASGVVQLGGTVASPAHFLMNSSVYLYPQNVTLRGSGPQATFLDFGTNNIQFGGISGTHSAPVLGSIAAGATSFTITTATPPPVGVLAGLSQCDTGSGSTTCATAPVDNGSVWVCGETGVCKDTGPDNSVFKHQYEAVLITSVTNNGNGTYTIGISGTNATVGEATGAIYMHNWSSSSNAQLTWNNDNTKSPIGFGIEDLTVRGNTSGTFIIQLTNAYASWVKGVRFLGAAGNAVLQMDGQPNKNNLFANNYCATHYNFPGGYHSCFFPGQVTDLLIINNFIAGSLFGEYRGRTAGVVSAYNFIRDGMTLETVNTLSFDHHAFGSYNLWEGDRGSAYTEDSNFGTHALNTYFRNSSACGDEQYIGYDMKPYVFQGAHGNRFTNIIGNAFGEAATCPTYQGGSARDAGGVGGKVFSLDIGDTLVRSTLMRWGNYVSCTGDAHCNTTSWDSNEVPSGLGSPNTTWANPVPSDHNLPASFFMNGMTAHPSGGTGLNWWKVCKTWNTFPTSCATTQTQPFPTAGPDVTGGTHTSGRAYDPPAAVAWQNLPIDTAYQNSYTITASSWSAGTETLTITGLPNLLYLLGPFQLSGLPAACTTGATVGPNNEVYITYSTATTISYALASNPGSNTCVGTNAFKFPNIRQFDQRVYQTDGGGTCSVSPTSLGPYTAGQVVNQQFTNSNCSAGTYSVSSGSLTGSGLTLNPSGLLSGTAVAGGFAFTVAYSTATDPLSLTINAAPSIITSSLPDGLGGTAYSHTLSTTGGTGAITCAVTSGSLPPGLTLTGCTISGTPQ